MRSAPFLPRLHVFVCANERADTGLGPGCSAHGDAVFTALKAYTLATARDIWVTRTGCMGYCPKNGCAVSVQPTGTYLVDVAAGDIPEVVAVLNQN